MVRGREYGRANATLERGVLRGKRHCEAQGLQPLGLEGPTRDLGTTETNTERWHKTE